MVSMKLILIKALMLVAILGGTSANAAIGVLAGVQLTPFIGYKFGAEWLTNNSLTYAITLSGGNSGIGSEKAMNRDASALAKFYPTEGAWYVSGGINWTTSEYIDSDPTVHQQIPRVSLKSKMDSRSTEVSTGSRWFLNDNFSIDLSWIGYRLGRSHETEESLFATGERRTTYNASRPYSRWQLPKIQAVYWF